MFSISIYSRNCVSRYLLNRFVSLLNSPKNKYFHGANLCFSSFLTTICIIRWFIGNQILYVDGCFNEFPLLQFILKKNSKMITKIITKSSLVRISWWSHYVPWPLKNTICLKSVLRTGTVISCYDLTPPLAASQRVRRPLNSSICSRLSTLSLQRTN